MFPLDLDLDVALRASYQTADPPSQLFFPLFSKPAQVASSVFQFQKNGPLRGHFGVTP
jgi:hypothetical protein